jgi:hypothetical protein
MHKHPAYADEQEYRLLISGDRDTISRCDLHCLRERKGEIVGYLNLPIPSWQQRGVLIHIRLGPAAPDGLRDHIRIALMTLGIPTLKIDKSDIPFRPMIELVTHVGGLVYSFMRVYRLTRARIMRARERR